MLCVLQHSRCLLDIDILMCLTRSSHLQAFNVVSLWHVPALICIYISESWALKENTTFLKACPVPSINLILAGLLDRFWTPFWMFYFSLIFMLLCINMPTKMNALVMRVLFDKVFLKYKKVCLCLSIKINILLYINPYNFLSCLPSLTFYQTINSNKGLE